MRSRRLKTAGQPFKQDGEFLWLISLSDLMILLFVFDVRRRLHELAKADPIAVPSSIIPILVLSRFSFSHE